MSTPPMLSGYSEGMQGRLSPSPRFYIAPTSVFSPSTSQPVDRKSSIKVHKNAPLLTSLAAEVSHP